MQPNPIPGKTNDARGDAAEAATLDRVLWLHPTHLTEPELLLNLYAGEGDQRTETFERAIHDLVADGLLRIDGDSVVPTLAAIRGEEIRR
jgi:hypothetical protein